MIYGEFEQEWLARVQSVCPGSAKRIQSLSSQSNFTDCVLKTIESLLNGGEQIPDNIVRVFLLLLGNEQASDYVSTLVHYQKSNRVPHSSEELSQWIAACTTVTNADYVISQYETLSPSIFNLLILSKVAAIRPDLIEICGQLYSKVLSSNPAFLVNVVQWRKKDQDKVLRKGFRDLEKWRQKV